MSNLAKLKKKAAELEQKKQFDKALALYVQMLEEADGTDEADVALYNRVGDLLLRQGNVGDALGYYEKAVDLYAEGGFFNNAIALCNKILRQSPGRSSIYYKLGKISAKKGFNSDAKANFLEYADRMQKAGQIDEAFRALKEFAELCPDQEDVRLMLAEQLAKKGRRGEALEQLQSLYDRFESEGRSSEARATVDRMKAIDPEAEPKAGNAPLKQKSSDLVFLDVSWDDQPKRPMRATVPVRPPVEALDPEPPRAARSPVADLPLLDTGERTAVPPGRDDRITVQATRLDDEPSDAPVAALDGLTQSVDFDSTSDAAREEEASLLGLEPTTITDTGERAAILASNVLNLEPPLSGSEFASLPLETPADSPAIRAEIHDLALPGDLPALGAADEDRDGEPVPDGGDLELIMPEPDLDMGPTATRGSLSEYAPPIANRDSVPASEFEPLELEDAPADAAFGMSSSGGALGDLPLIDVGDELDLGEEAAPVEIGGDASRLSRLDAIEPASLDFAADLVTEGTAPDVLPTIGDVAAADPPPARVMTEADIARRLPDEAAVQPATLDALADVTEEGEESPLAPAAQVRRSSTSTLAQSVDGLRARAAAEPENWALRRELGEALLDDGDREAGLAELDAAMVGYERAGNLDTARSIAGEIIRVEPNSVRHHQKGVEYAFRTNDKLRLTEAYLQLADALYRTGQQDKARAVYQRVIELAPDDVRAQAALAQYTEPAAPPRAEPPAAPRASTVGRRYTGDEPPAAAAAARASAPTERPDDDFVNLGDWLRDTEGPKSTRMVVDEEQPTGDEEADFAEMLRKFKQGVAENVDEGDHESHYDLGVAFKEMGLLDEAIAEFQKALRGAQKRVRTYEALGQCFLEKKQYQIASTILQRALAEGHGDDQLVGVLYLLGYSAEALQQWPEAIGYYQRVFAVDIQFRDVTERLTNLEQRVGR